MKKYKLDMTRDVDFDGESYMFNLLRGWRFYNDAVHVRGFDTLAEIRAAAKTDVIPCACRECAPAAEPLFAAV